MLKVSNKISQTEFKNSNKYFKHSISLPIYPSLSEKCKIYMSKNNRSSRELAACIQKNFSKE